MILKYLKSVAVINAVQFLALSVMAVNLSAVSYGEFRVIYAYWLSAAAIGLMGLNQSLIREYKNIQKSVINKIFSQITFVLAITSIIATLIVAYFIIENYYGDFALILSLCVCIYGYMYFSIISARLQATGDDKGLLKVQTYSKVVVFLAAAASSFTLKTSNVFIGIAISYLILMIALNKDTRTIRLPFSGFKKINEWNSFFILLKNSYWPWLLAIVAALSQHIEFLSSQALGLDEDSIGKLGYANLIFMGLTAVFFAFQNYALTRFATLSLAIEEITKYQFVAIGLMLLACVCVYLLSHSLNYFAPEKFDVLFLHYSNLMIVKSIAWSSLCIQGSLLYYYGHSVASFIIGCLPITAAIYAAYNVGSIDSLVYAQSVAYVLSALIIYIILSKRVMR